MPERIFSYLLFVDSMTMTVTSYCFNRISRGLMDMILNLVERSCFEYARDYANYRFLHFTGYI